MKMSNKAIFMDRDDTLIEDPGYINDPDQVKLLDGVPEALVEFRNMGYKLVVVSNQSAVARGIVTEKVLDDIHDRLKQLLAKKQAYLDNIYYCPYHPNGVISKYRKESDLRKPNPGMLLAAAEQMDIDLGQSWAIGNSEHDVEAGRRAGCKTILIDNSSHSKKRIHPTLNPDYRAVNIKEVVNIIKKHLRSPAEDVQKTEPLPTAQTQMPSQISDEPQPTARPAKPPQETTSQNTNEQLLNSILKQLKSMRRENMFDEFSVMRLIAGVFQIVALACLFTSIWFVMSPDRQNETVLISLGFAVMLQLISLTFYIQGRK